MAASATGYAVGINKGFQTKKIDLPAKPSNKRGVRILPFYSHSTAQYSMDG
jgi:hypothetical protein